MSSRRRAHGLLTMTNRACSMSASTRPPSCFPTHLSTQVCVTTYQIRCLALVSNIYHHFFFFATSALTKRCSFVSTGTPFCSYFEVFRYFSSNCLCTCVVISAYDHAHPIFHLGKIRACGCYFSDLVGISLRFNFPFLLFRYNTFYI